MALIQDVRLPDLGNISQAEIIEILVIPGTRVAADASLLTLESDKATLEIPAPSAGVITDVIVKLGDRVSTGALLLRMDVDVDVDTDTKQPEQPILAPQSPSLTPQDPNIVNLSQRLPVESGQTRPPIAARPSDYASNTPHASPAVRRFARELGVNIGQITGTGPKERILKTDVQQFVQNALIKQPQNLTHDNALQLPSVPEVDFSRFGPVVSVPRSRLRQLSGTHLQRCWITVPHVTQFDAADITELETFRQAENAAITKQKPRLTLLPFVIKACAVALQTLPIFNSSLAADGKNLLVRQYVNIGIAVNTDNGLVVPVIRDIDRQNITQIAQTINDISVKARTGKLAPADLQGGCFSISNLGGICGGFFTPIINAPQVAILGIARAEMRPVWNGREFAPKLMLPLSLSYDHRVIDGVDGAQFIILINQLLGDIRRLLL